MESGGPGGLADSVCAGYSQVAGCWRAVIAREHGSSEEYRAKEFGDSGRLLDWLEQIVWY